MSLNNGNQRRLPSENQVPVHQRRRISPKPAVKNGERSFGRVLQPITTVAEKRVICKPNPHERLWNPSPSKKAKARDKEVKIYDYDKENEVNEDSERRSKKENVEHAQDLTTCNRIKTERDDDLKNLRNRYIIDNPTSYNIQTAAPVPLPSAASSSTDLNNSFTEKISNLEIGFQNESPQPQPRPSSATGVWNEQKNPEYPYITEILNYWHILEENYRINPNYMTRQKEISHKMRTILVDWIAEVVEECKICNATFHRCIQYIDRFLSKLQISRNNLQLLGTACLFIACKIEEIHPPETGDLVYLTDNTYDKGQLLRMECLVLSKLDFDLLVPTAYEFTEYFSNCLSLTTTAKEFSMYVVDLTLLHGEKFLKFNASVTAASACYVAVRCCGDSRFNVKGTCTIREVLGRIKRLHPTSDFYKSVELAVSTMFEMIMIVGSERDAGNSICNKYRQFQDQKYFVAAATCAACFSLPWYSVGLMTG